MKKAILWIEDFTEEQREARKPNNEGQFESEMIKTIFGETYRGQVELEKTLYAGVKHIIERHGDYDCVILDINMKNNLEYKRDEVWEKFGEMVYLPKKWDEKCEKRIPDIEVIGKNAGYYLTILLYSLGFPKDRIILFSAYEDTLKAEKTRNLFMKAGFYPPQIIKKR